MNILQIIVVLSVNTSVLLANNKEARNATLDPAPDARGVLMESMLSQHDKPLRFARFDKKLRKLFTIKSFSIGQGVIPIIPAADESVFVFNPEEGKTGNYAIAYILTDGVYTSSDSFFRALANKGVRVKRIDLVYQDGGRKSTFKK